MSYTVKNELCFLKTCDTIWLPMLVLAYFWYFKIVFIFRGPICQLFKQFTNIWQPWKWNLTPYYCLGRLKTHESEFLFSGLPNFGYQGCHISEGAGRIIFQLMSFNAIGSKNMVELSRCFGNPMRELFQSRHFVNMKTNWN